MLPPFWESFGRRNFGPPKIGLHQDSSNLHRGCSHAPPRKVVRESCDSPTREQGRGGTSVPLNPSVDDAACTLAPSMSLMTKMIPFGHRPGPSLLLDPEDSSDAKNIMFSRKCTHVLSSRTIPTTKSILFGSLPTAESSLETPPRRRKEHPKYACRPGSCTKEFAPGEH